MEGQNSLFLLDCKEKEKLSDSDDEAKINIEPVESPLSLEQYNIFSEDEEEDWSEERMLELVQSLYQDDKLLKAARVLQKVVNNSSKLSPQNLKQEHKQLLRLADECEKLINRFDIDEDDAAENENEGSWICASKSSKKMTEKDMTGNTNLHYKTNSDHSELELRVETPIRGPLLVPLISVMNESQLFYTWLPSWKLPPVKFGIRPVVKLKQIGRCSQVIIVTFDLPWPLSPRQVVLQAVAADDIDDNGNIVVKLDTLQEGDLDGLIPPAEENIARLELNGGILIRKNPNDPKFILLQYYGHIKRSYSVPSWFVKFLVKTVVSTIWDKFLNITKEVKDGKREKHAQVIQEKWDDLYQWVETRAAAMLGI
jgi:hypothetical protein